MDDNSSSEAVPPIQVVQGGGINYIDVGEIDHAGMQESMLEEDIRNLRDDAANQAFYTDIRASIYKAFCQLIDTSIIVMTAVSGFLGILEEKSSNVNYAIAALCFTSAGLKSALQMSGLYRRAISIKVIASQMRKLSRDAEYLVLENTSSEVKLKRYMSLCSAYDELNLQVFSSDITRVRSPITEGSTQARYSRASARAQSAIPINRVYQ